MTVDKITPTRKKKHNIPFNARHDGLLCIIFNYDSHVHFSMVVCTNTPLFESCVYAFCNWAWAKQKAGYQQKSNPFLYPQLVSPRFFLQFLPCFLASSAIFGICFFTGVFFINSGIAFT